jgi:hypothetical protein
MDCREAQEQILESLSETRPDASVPGLTAHVASCGACRSFTETQLRLDLRLTAAIQPPRLSRAFRSRLSEKLRRDPLALWPDVLPEAAHAVGCLCATGLCLLMLPLPAGLVVVGALAFTIVTCFVQTVLRASLEAWEEGTEQF